ncbi:MAG TPA: leucine-rich repeat protein [Bacilli bacterium]|nr:leucine-rich repeat protein [Bacilli bacterium]
MYDIKIKANANGRLEYEDPVVRLGTEDELSRARLVFSVDDSIEGAIRYVKFKHAKATYLYRVTNDALVVPTTVTKLSGRWFISFISSNNVVTNNVPTGSYAFISEPVEAVVADGILSANTQSEEAQLLCGIIDGTADKVVIPTSVTRIREYCLSYYQAYATLVLHPDISFIGSHAFEGGKFQRIEFQEGIAITSIQEYSFQKMENLASTYVLKVPKSVSSWGRNAFGSSNLSAISFESGSKLTTFVSYSIFNMTALRTLELPAGFLGFTGNGQTISSCPVLAKIILPNSFTYSIIAGHIVDNPSLADIVLGSNWNCVANFSKCTNLSANSIKAMFASLKNLTGSSAKALTLGSDNLAKVSTTDIAVATAKNWTVS